MKSIKITHEIKSYDVIRVSAFNATSGNIPSVGYFGNKVLAGIFGTVSNLGNFSQQGDSRIGYEATVRGEAIPQNKNGRRLAVKIQPYIESSLQPPISLYLTVIIALLIKT